MFFTFKAWKTFSALSSAGSSDYEKVKLAVLVIYALVPEAYRQRFTNWRKGDKQTYVDRIFWLISHIGALIPVLSNYDDLIVLEKFKSFLPAHLATYINEKKVKPWILH